MPVPVRRGGVAAAGILAALLLPACSSSGGSGPPTSVVTSEPTVVPSVSVSVPVGTSGGGSATAFCHDFTHADLSNLYNTRKVDQVVKLWDGLTGDAPSPVADDMKTVDDYLHQVAGGNPVPPGSDVAAAIKNVTTWVAAHCR